ncbi:hypothetical protein BC940DRAFT_312735, partial [Gongronella butleri]
MKLTLVFASLFVAGALAAPVDAERKMVARGILGGDGDGDGLLNGLLGGGDSDNGVFDGDHDHDGDWSGHGGDDADQSATINNNVAGGGDGGLIGVNANNALAGGVLSDTHNKITQKN